MSRPWMLVAAAGVAVTLAGCTPAPIFDAVPPTRSPSPFSLPSPSATVQDPAVAIDPGPCDAVGSRFPADAGQVEQLSGWTLLTPIDLGPRPYANGTAEYDANSVPVAYTVSSHDTIESIGARFCLSPQYLFLMNLVRRDDSSLYVGDVLNLDAHSILSVGDQNGVVFDNPPPPPPLPPQH